MILQKRREIYKRWVERQDIEVVRAKQREKSKRYYEKKRMMKELAKQQENNAEHVEAVQQIQESESESSEAISNQSTNIETSENDNISGESTCDEAVNNKSIDFIKMIYDNTIKILVRAYKKLSECDKSSDEYSRGLFTITCFLHKTERDFDENFLISVILETIKSIGAKNVVLELSFVNKLLKHGARVRHIHSVRSYDHLTLIT